MEGSVEAGDRGVRTGGAEVPVPAPEVPAGSSRVEQPRWWVFTFGCGHEHAGHYVRIHGTFSEARAEMVRRFGRDWAFQYTEEEWDRAVQDLRMNGYGMMVETEMEVDWDD